jgi:hypothetical protein
MATLHLLPAPRKGKLDTKESQPKTFKEEHDG